MEACLLQLLRGLLLLGTAATTVCALGTGDLVELCGRTWQGDALRLRSHPASRRVYFVARDTDCALWMRAAAPGDRIRFQFRFFLVYSLSPASRASPAPSSPAPADPCAPGSYLQFYDGPPGAPRALGPPTCGLTIPAPVTSSGPFLGLRLVTRGRRPRVDFVGEVTSFRLGFCGSYFRCRNGRCVPRSLLCDAWGMDNCGDGSDQDSLPPASCRGPTAAPEQTKSSDGNTTKPPTTAERCSGAGWTPAQQDAMLEGPQLWQVMLASSLLLASASLLTGLLWCHCCPSWLAWPLGARGLHFRCCTACYLCPSRVAPGGRWLNRPAFQNQGGHP